MVGKHTEATKEKMRQAKLVNPTRYWLGKKRPEMQSPEFREKMSKIQKERVALGLNNFGDGTATGYWSIHQWLYDNFGKANHCENPECLGLSKIFHWAKKVGCEYERKRENFMQLCVKCHSLYDFTKEKKERFLKVRYIQPKNDTL